MKSSGRGLSASARRSSGVISRLIGTPQIACACASSAARSDSADAAPFVQIGSCGGSGSFGRVDVERIAVGAAAAHLQRPEHVGRAAGERAAAATLGIAAARRRRSAAAVAVAAPAAAAAHHDEEALEDARRQERREPVVVLIQPEAVQVARRRLEIVAGAQRHGLAVRPAERLAIEREEVLEVPRVKVRADAAARPALRDDEQELAGRVRVAREERVAAEPLAAAVGEHVGAGRQRQLLVGDADRRAGRRRRRRQLEIAGRSGARQRGRGNLVRNVRRAPAARPAARPSP